MIKIKNITKIFGSTSSSNGNNNKKSFTALKNVDFSVVKGEFVAIMGPSGSGKSTLMNIIGCLESATSGSYFLDNVEIKSIENSNSKVDNELSFIRNKKIGFIFQQFNLISNLSVEQNVEVPLIYDQSIKSSSSSSKEKLEKVKVALDKVGILDKIKSKPSQLSGGEKQRVAIARALINEPSIILADEPTGSLDQKTGLEIMELLIELNKAGNTIIVVTHDEKVGSFADRIVRLLDGEIV